MNNIFENKYSFKHLLPINIILVIIIICTLLLLLLSYFLIKIKIYDHYQTKGYVENGLITTIIPSSLNFEKIYLDNKEVNYEITNEIVKVDKETMTSYKEITFKCLHNFKDNEIITITFYYNKQRIITKLKNRMF